MGLAAATGKAGAAIGTQVGVYLCQRKIVLLSAVQVFTPIQNSFDSDFQGVQAVFLIGAAFAATGGIIAWTLIPDRERDLESEDTRFRAYLEEHGFSGDFGESLGQQIKGTAFKV